MRGLDCGPGARLWSTPSLENVLLDEIYLDQEVIPTTSVSELNLPLTRLLEEANIPSTIFNLPPPNVKIKKCALSSDKHEEAQLANQFRLPAELSSIERLITSVQLQISRKTCHQLRYSATGTILFHQLGTRKVLLSPPFNQSKLGYAPGSNISDLNILCDPTLLREHSFYTIPGTSTHVAMMQPGDALYVPPFWSRASVVLRGPSHSIGTPQTRTDSDGSSPSAAESLRAIINLNKRPPITGNETPPSSNGKSDSELNPLDITFKVSFRILPHSALAKTLDENWSAELKAYEDSRRDLEAVMKRFTSCLGKSNGEPDTQDRQAGADMLLEQIPKDVAKVYLQRLGKELLMKAEEL
jgi:hypothetical protein